MTTVFLTHSPDMLAGYYGDRAVAALREMAEVRINATGRVLDSAEALIGEAGEAAIIVSDRQTPGFSPIFAALPNLCAFLRCAVDIRNVDVAAASRAGILVTHATPGFMTSVSELAVGFMIDLSRGISRSVGQYRAGLEAEVRTGRQLKGAIAGIIGFGTISRELAPILLALGMEVLVTDPYGSVPARAGLRQVRLEELLAGSDYVICLALATEETENLMDASAFARMRRDAVFLNLSRGNLVDEAALEAALAEGRIAGAAMDVGRAPDQKPSLRLAGRPDVIATPHIAGLTPAAVEHQAFDTVGQVRALLAGETPQGAVNLAEASRLARLSARYAGRRRA